MRRQQQQLTALEQEMQRKGFAFAADHEDAIASALLHNNGKEIFEILIENGIDRKEFFHQRFNQNIFESVKELLDDGLNVDSLAIRAKLRKKFNWPELKLLEKLMELEEAFESSSAWDAHIHGLKEYYQRRQNQINAIEQEKSAIKSYHESFNGKFKPILNDNISKESSLFNIRKRWLESPHKDTSIITPFPLLNAHIGGIRGLAGVIGIPKAAKTTLCMQLALHAAKKEVYTVYVDFENGVIENMKRTYQQVIKCESDELDQKIEQMNDDILIPWSSEYYHVYDISTIQGPEDLNAKIPRNKKVFIIIDSLQKCPSLSESPRESINKWLRELEKIKTDTNLNCSILFTSELNRKSYKTDMDLLAGAKESGDIEYSVDVLLALLPTKEESIRTIKVVASRNTTRGDVGKYGLTKYRYFVENPDPESFREIKFTEKNDNKRVLDAINELKKENAAQVTISDLVSKTGLDDSLVGRILSKMKYFTDRDRTKGVRYITNL